MESVFVCIDGFDLKFWDSLVFIFEWKAVNMPTRTKLLKILMARNGAVLLFSTSEIFCWIS